MCSRKPTKMAASSSFISAATKRLDGKVVLITGGASGLGEFTAKVFAFHGAKVVIADIQDETGRAVCKALPGSIYVHCDVTDEAQVQQAVDTAVATYGKLDIMYCNAGILDPNKPRIVDVEKHDFERVISINVTGVFLGIKQAARVMIPNRNGVIICTSSTASAIAACSTHAYTASKHAVVGLTRNAAAELGQFGVRVNCVSPYGVATPLATNFVGISNEELENSMDACANLHGVTLKAEDVANAVLYLASDEARYVSGQNLVIDGGFSIANHTFGLFKYPDQDHSDVMPSSSIQAFSLKSIGDI